MRHLYFRFCFLAGILLAAIMQAPEARAWRDDGHLIVCHIAFMELSPSARSEIARLIRSDQANPTFAEACIWADAIKYTTQPHTEPWHYMNLKADDMTVDMSDCSSRGCLLSAIALHRSALLGPNVSDTTRLEAVKFLGHWLGDIHQPLHFGGSENRGGNQVHIVWRPGMGPTQSTTADAQETNLHKVWDDDILQAARMEPFKYATRLWMTISDEERAEWAASEPIVWAQESRDIAAAAETMYLSATPGAIVTLGTDYADRTLPIVESQLKKGGVRLAALLSQLLGAGPE